MGPIGRDLSIWQKGTGVMTQVAKKASGRQGTVLDVILRLPGLEIFCLLIVMGLAAAFSGKAMAQACFFGDNEIGSSPECSEEQIESTTDQKLRNILRTTQRQIRNRMVQLRQGGSGENDPQEAQLTDLGFADYQSASADAAGSDPLGIAVWADFSISKLESDVFAQEFDGTALGILIGADRLVGDSALVGVILGGESGEFDLLDGGERSMDGVSLTLYGGMLLDDVFSVDALVSYARLDNDILNFDFGTPITGKFDSDRISFAANLAGMWELENYFLTGTLGYAYAHEEFDSYRNVPFNQLVDPADLTLSQARLGAELSRPMEKIEPYLELMVEHDFENSGLGDDTGALATFGLRSLARDGVAIGAQLSGQLFRKDESDITFGLNIRASL
jgi:outer membrane autotransporter protein